jgi:hypothetical protein
VVRSERPAAASENSGFAAMNHTTRLRETRSQKAEPEESALEEIGLEGNVEDSERASEE